MRLRSVGAVALADLREQSRRPAFLMALITAAGFGYLMFPPAEATWGLMLAGDYRGVYNSAYIGTLMASAGGFWLALAGFFFVKSSVAYDEASHVGELLAATRVSDREYTLAKALSNFLVLCCMAAVLAVAAVVMQFVRAESGTLDLVALWLPLVLVSVPMLALTAAIAILFEVIPLLRGGVGNLVWFLLWVLITTPSIGMANVEELTDHDPLGLSAPFASLSAAAAAQYPDAERTGMSLGVAISEQGPPGVFHWDGYDITIGYVLTRIAVLAAAVGIAVLAARWFTRFDPARWHGGSHVIPTNGGEPAAPVTAPAAGPSGGATTLFRPRSSVRLGNTTVTVLVGEARVLLHGVSRWWWLTAAAVVVAGLVIPTDIAGTAAEVPAAWVAQSALLPVAWILPLLIWARIGSQHQENNVTSLTGACPSRRRRMATEWGVGVLLTATVGVAALVRSLVAADWQGAAMWAAGAVFIPSLALMLGVVSRSGRLFQLVYFLLWYAVMSGSYQVDYMGVLRGVTPEGGPGPVLVTLVAAACVLVAFAVSELRHARR